MVKLAVKDTRYKRESVFYFKTMKECDEFLYVFRDHMCNVPWEKPIVAPEFPEMTDGQRRYMLSDKTPKEKAESNLFWGFNLVDHLGIGIDKEQEQFIANMLSRIG